MTKKNTRVPPGSPPWVTEDLIAKTIRVWQSYRKEKITEDDAVEMLLNVGHLFDAMGFTEPPEISASEVATVAPHGDHFEKAIRKHLERPDLTPIQEARLYEAMMMEINPTTGRKWKLKEIARHFGKSYGHVRNRWALVMPFKPDDVDDNGNIIKKGQGLTDEERSALERGEKTLIESVRRAYRKETGSEEEPQSYNSRSPVSLRELQTLFDNTAEDNVERRKAIAECMGLTLKQAIKWSHRTCL